MHTLRHIKSNAGYNNGSEQMLLYIHTSIRSNIYGHKIDKQSQYEDSTCMHSYILDLHTLTNK